MPFQSILLLILFRQLLRNGSRVSEMQRALGRGIQIYLGGKEHIYPVQCAQGL